MSPDTRNRALQTLHNRHIIIPAHFEGLYTSVWARGLDPLALLRRYTHHVHFAGANLAATN